MHSTVQISEFLFNLFCLEFNCRRSLNNRNTNKAHNRATSHYGNENRLSFRQPMRDTSNMATHDDFALDPLIEGSLQYREMKRLYVNEKKQSDEWRKDYHILKRQLAELRAKTIRKLNVNVLANRDYTVVGDAEKEIFHS